MGTPDEVYNRPESRYVASFVGSPIMNFLEGGRLQVEADALWFTAGGLRFALPQAVSAKIAGLRSAVDLHDDILLGIRPEAIRLGESHENGRFSEAFPGRIDLVQSLGSQTVVSVTVGGLGFLVLADPAFAMTRGEEVRVRFDLSKVHAFQRSTGRSVFHI